MLYEAEQKLDKHILLGFTGSKAEKVKVAQWLDEGCNAAKIRWAQEADKDTAFKEKIVGNSLTMTGLAVMCSLTPPTMAIGAGMALLGQGIKFMGRLCTISNASKDILQTARFEISLKEKREAQTPKSQPPKPTP